MTTLLLAYDGSDDAKAALDHAARLLPGATTHVLSVWEPLMLTVLRSGAGGLGVGYVGETTEIDDAARAACADCAAEGAGLATAAGLDATPRVAVSEGDLARTILEAAEDLDAGVVVLGTRGLGGVRSFLLGSVSHHVLQHADRPVMVVPSAARADERRAWVATHAQVADA
jgi:nucleotide-binding universal stress UspA family protein